MQNKKAKNKRNSRQKGFSLVEVLIAIAILAAITIPLAMNMISTSQINSKSKSTSTAADLSASVLESMQSVNLSDLLVEMNGYETNEYGEKLAYSIADNSLHGFTVGDTFEARVSKDETKSYVPVTKQADGMADSLVTSSIKVRKTNDDVVKTYFTGHKGEDGKIDNSYSVVMQDVHNDEDSFDIVMDIKEGQSYDMASINSMDQSNIVTMFESSENDKDVVKTILSDNRMAHSVDKTVPILGDANDDETLTEEDREAIQKYVSDQITLTELQKKACDLNGDGQLDILDSTLVGRQIKNEASSFGKIYNKEYIITIQQDKNTEATNIIIDCKYNIIYPELVGNKKVINKRIGVFSTNSTFEFAKGIYLYFIPSERDTFTINNRNELSTTVYLIASTENENFLKSYEPSITVNELSSQVYIDSARTTICSNIPNEKWTTKTVIPAKNNELEIKTLANVGSQQTLYNVSVKIYKHNKSSFNADNVFVPNEKNLLIQTDGSFLDNSVMHDIDSNKTTGVSMDDKLATVVPVKVVYNGEEQSGYTANNVTLSGDVKATNAGRYTVFAKPNAGYAWADGTNAQRSFEWEIQHLKAAKAEIASGQSEFVYDGQTHSPVFGEHVQMNGATKGKDAKLYTVSVVPEENYAWEDAAEGKEREIRYINWQITRKPVTVEWGTVSWTYNGMTHIAQCRVKKNDLVEGDSCDVILENHRIKNVGKQTATVSSLTNPNYVLADGAERNKEIEVVSNGIIKSNVREGLVYNGDTQKGILFSSNDAVTVKSGQISAVDAGEYTAVVGLAEGYKWEDGSSEDRTFAWKIAPLEVEVKWGDPTWYNIDRTDDWATVKSNQTETIRCHFTEDNEIDEIQWPYDGNAHSVKDFQFIANGTVITSLNAESVLMENNSITDVGDTIIHIYGFNNNNYTCDAVLKISVSAGGSYFTPVANIQYNGQEQCCSLNYNEVKIAKVAGKYPITCDGKVPEQYNSETEYTVKDIIYQINAGTYSIWLEPMDNFEWNGGGTEPREFTWTIKPIKDAWISGMKDDGTVERVVYSYTGSDVECAYGENIILTNNAAGTIQSGTISDDETGEETLIAWVEVKEKGDYTVDATPAPNHAWINPAEYNLQNDTKTIPVRFNVGDPIYKARFNMSPVAWVNSNFRYYNGEELGPYFTDLIDCYPLEVLGRKKDPVNAIAGFLNDNTKIVVSGDKKAWKVKSNDQPYELKHKNEMQSDPEGTYLWKIKERPIRLDSMPEISRSESDNNSIDIIKALIKEKLNIKAGSKLIEEALTFSFATQETEDESYYVRTWDNGQNENNCEWVEVQNSTIYGLKQNMRFMKGKVRGTVGSDDVTITITRQSDKITVKNGATYELKYDSANADNLTVKETVDPNPHIHDANLKYVAANEEYGTSAYWMCESCGEKFENANEASLNTVKFSGENDSYHIRTWDDENNNGREDANESGVSIEINGKSVSGLKQKMYFTKSGRKSDTILVKNGATYIVSDDLENRTRLTVSEDTTDAHEHTLEKVPANAAEGISEHWICTHKTSDGKETGCGAEFSIEDVTEKGKVKINDITFFADDTIKSTNSEKPFKALGYNDSIESIDIKLYKDDREVSDDNLQIGKYTFKINSITIKHNDGTDVTYCYQIDFTNARGTITILSTAGQSAENGSDIAINSMP